VRTASPGAGKDAGWSPPDQSRHRTAHPRGADVLKKVLWRLVDFGREGKVVRSSKLHVGTTVRDSYVHYPTASSVLSDGVSVLTRTMKKLPGGSPRRHGGYSAVQAAKRSAHIPRQSNPARQQDSRSVAGESRSVCRGGTETSPCGRSQGGSVCRPGRRRRMRLRVFQKATAYPAPDPQSTHRKRR
jgi:hypothetical protein